MERVDQSNLGMGVKNLISFGPDKHQGSDRVYYKTLKNNEFVPVVSWEQWKK